MTPDDTPTWQDNLTARTQAWAVRQAEKQSATIDRIVMAAITEPDAWSRRVAARAARAVVVAFAAGYLLGLRNRKDQP